MIPRAFPDLISVYIFWVMSTRPQKVFLIPFRHHTLIQSVFWNKKLGNLKHSLRFPWDFFCCTTSASRFLWILNNIVTFCWFLLCGQYNGMKNVLHASISYFSSLQYILNGRHKNGWARIWRRKWWNVLLINNNSNFFFILLNVPKAMKENAMMFQFISPCWHHQFMRTMNSFSFITFLLFIACTLWSFIGCYCDTLLALLWDFLYCFDWERVVNWILLTIDDQIPSWLRFEIILYDK